VKTTITDIHFSIDTDINTASEIVAEVEALMAARDVTIRGIGTVSHTDQVGPAWDHEHYASAGGVHLLKEFPVEARYEQTGNHEEEEHLPLAPADSQPYTDDADQSFNEAWDNMFDTSRSSTTFKKLAVTFDVVFERLPDTPPENYVTDKVIRPLYNSGVRIDSWRISDSSEFEV
jgi:hypothetical protein